MWYDGVMDVDTAATVSTARAYAGLSVRQSAAIAGVSASTVSRIERGELDPTVETFGRILQACGYRYGAGLIAAIDMSAVRAARRMLDPESPLPATDGSDSWERRWSAAGLARGATPTSRAISVASAAARQASLFDRPGAIGVRGGDWRSLAETLRASGQRWALTGGRAAALYTQAATVDWTVFYVDDVEEALALAGVEPVEIGQDVTLLPFDEVTSAQVQQMDGGLCVADFWQIAIDCFAGDGRMPAQAEAMIRRRLGPGPE